MRICTPRAQEARGCGGLREEDNVDQQAAALVAHYCDPIILEVSGDALACGMQRPGDWRGNLMKTSQQAKGGQARIPDAHFRGQPRLPQMHDTSMSLKRQTADSELRTKSNWANALGKRISTAQPTVSLSARNVSSQFAQAHKAFLSMEKEARADQATKAFCRERAANCRRCGRGTCTCVKRSICHGTPSSPMSTDHLIIRCSSRGDQHSRLLRLPKPRAHASSQIHASLANCLQSFTYTFPHCARVRLSEAFSKRRRALLNFTHETSRRPRHSSHARNATCSRRCRHCIRVFVCKKRINLRQRPRQIIASDVPEMQARRLAYSQRSLTFSLAND